MNDPNAIVKLLNCFRDSFINNRWEFVAHRLANEYFDLSDCEDETDMKAKVLEYLSRAASKGQPFQSDKANAAFHQFMLDGINKYLGTTFSEDDIYDVYTYLGNRCNHTRTLKFIASGYRVDLLPFAEEEG